jgi:transcriptional regulator with XRE-family HTH domain
MEDTFFALFPSQLKEERIRLGLTQAKAAELCGVRREAWGQYERGSVVPGAQVLFRFVSHGADAGFIFTGERLEARPPLEDRERLRLAVEAVEEGLAAIHRKLSPDKKTEIILAAYDLMAERETDKGKIVQLLKLVV